jgi:hypothetical protein
VLAAGIMTNLEKTTRLSERERVGVVVVGGRKEEMREERVGSSEHVFSPRVFSSLKRS